MSRKQLAIKLSKLINLDKLDVSLEQYQTDSNLAAEFLWLAYTNGDIQDKVIADFGCGNGILGIGALILGAKFVYFLDISENALEKCKENIKLFKFKNYKLINSDVVDFSFDVNAVVMNPPFGVQRRKADKMFLETAMKFSNKIYSIHKIESQKFIEKLAEEKGFKILDIVKAKFFIKRSYNFHTKEKYDIDVGYWVLSKS